ncbi:hypothetical protein H5410_029955 [Solanum commersonii]|uniref:F-box domain-containing protein n=1 Tax=Solanum commersonii TaxID=4109 RepID=A0A9J5YE94_SOLCO|nr:hypothetical protein H5410_029955 [Solanum commersonii]
MTNNNRAEERMEFDDDMVGKIISHLPLKFANQCKVSSKKFKSRILNPYFFQLLFQNQQTYYTRLIYSSHILSTSLYKIFLKPTAIIQCSMNLSCDVDLLASCNGLILSDLEEIMIYCNFNPITKEHQLIPYQSQHILDTYKLVTIIILDENFNWFYKFHVLSSDRSGVWCEIQLRANTSISLSFYCLLREEAIQIVRPQFIDHFDLNYVIATYNNASNNCKVSHILVNFVDNRMYCFHPILACVHKMPSNNVTIAHRV